MKLFKNYDQEVWFNGLPGARIPYGDEDKLTEYFQRSDLGQELSGKDFLFAVKKRLFIEWCMEQLSKGLPAKTSDFDFGVYERLIAEEIQYEFERSTLPEDRKNRGTFYEVRNRVLEAFVSNAVLFLNENQGIDGLNTRRNLRCDLSQFITRPKEQIAV